MGVRSGSARPCSASSSTNGKRDVTDSQTAVALASRAAASRTPLPRSSSHNRSDSELKVVAYDRELTSTSLDEKDQRELLRAGKHLQTLLYANRIISTELDTATLLERTLDALFGTFAVHRAVVLTLDGNGELSVRATRVRGDPSEASPRISSSIAYRALEDRVGVLTLDAAEDQRFDKTKSVIDLGIRSAICAPMIHRDKARGVIYLDTVGVTRTFGEEDLELLNGIAAAAAGALANAALVDRLKSTAADTIFRLAIAAEYRDGDTGFHIHRMSDYAAAIADALGHDPGFCENLRLSSPMHDIGKIGIPDSILKKPGKLTPDEFEIMKSHTTKGGAILAGSDSELLRMAERVALSHHEKFDGSGYPNGLSGSDIPVEGRIVAVADVFDALSSKRVYKEAFDQERTLDLVREGVGKHFDPDVVEAFFSIQDQLDEIRTYYANLEANLDGQEPTFEDLWKRSLAVS